MKWLLADCGNSSCKLGLGIDGEVSGARRVPGSREALEEHGKDLLSDADALLLLPTGRTNAARVVAWWRHHRKARPITEIGTDLALPDVGQYPTMGQDRVVAGLAAVHSEQQSVIVIDAGTAVTLAAWTALDGTATFQGGLILPSPRACLVGLHAVAPSLPEVDAAIAEPDPTPHDTPRAMANALAIGHGAMVQACLERLESATGIHHRVLTGGNADPLLGGGLATQANHPWLILEGLARLAQDVA